MTALRLPVEATRVERIDGQPPIWFVGDEAGRTEVDLGGNLRAAFARLARSQELWPVWGSTAPIPDWRARIAEEKARWSERAFLDEVAPSDPGDVLAIGDAWNAAAILEIAAANAQPYPSEHKV